MVIIANRRILPKFKLSNSSSTALDLVRALSAQIVLIGHSMSFLNIFPLKNSTTPLYIQNFGVLVFFILSGFLITYSTINKLDSLKYGFINYFTDRFVRIYIAYLPILILVFLFDSFIYVPLLPDLYKYSDALNCRTLVLNLFMLQDFQLNHLALNTSITSLGSARPLWTLALEWWFYMFFGWLVFYDKLKLPSIIKAIILLLLLLVPLINTVFNLRGNCLGIVWFLGCFIHLLASNGFLKNISIRKTCAILAILSILLLFRVLANQNDFYDFRAGFLTAAIIYFLICLFQKIEFSINDKMKFLIKTTSDYSFTLYLIHYTIIDFYHLYFTNSNKWMSLIITFILCNLIGFVVAYFTEFRHKKMRNWVLIKFGV